MSHRECPKCKQHCDVTESNIDLGVPIICECGCRFEYFPDPVPTVYSFPSGFDQSSNGKKGPSTTTTAPPASAPKLRWRAFAACLALWLSISLLLNLSFINILLICGIISTGFFFANKKEWKAHKSKSFFYYFFDKGFELFVSLDIVLIFYAIVSWIVGRTNDETTLATLWKMEDFFVALKGILQKYLIFKPWVAAVIIVSAIFIDLIASYLLAKAEPETPNAEADKEPRKTLTERFISYQKWSKRVYIVLALLCSFTFFGNVVGGERLAYLRLRIDNIKAGYEEIKEETEAAVTSSVQQQLYNRIDTAFLKGYDDKYRTQSFGPHHEIIHQRAKKVADLKEKFQAAKNDPKVQLTEDAKAQITEVINKNSSGRPVPGEPVPYADSSGDIKTHRTENAPSKKTGSITDSDLRSKDLGDLSVKKVEKIKTSLRERRTSRVLSVLKINDVKQLLVQFPKSVTNLVKSGLFKELVKDYPFLEPMVDTMVSSFDKTVEEKVSAAVDKKISEWSKSKNEISVSQTDFSGMAETISRETEIRLDQETINRNKPVTDSFFAPDTEIARSSNMIDEAKARPQPPKAFLTNETIASIRIPEATCIKTATENYNLRLSQARTYDDIMKAKSIYDNDMKRLSPSAGKFEQPSLTTKGLKRLDAG